MPTGKLQKYVERAMDLRIHEQKQQDVALVNSEDRPSSFEDCSESAYERLYKLLEQGGWTGLRGAKKYR